MADILDFKDQIPKKFRDILCDIISPINISYFKSTDTFLNFQCHLSQIEKYKKDSTYSIYDIEPLLRICLTKASIVTDDLLDTIYKDKNSEFVYILEWDEKKAFIIFDISNLAFFEDKKLVKELTKRRVEIAKMLDMEID